MTRTTRNLLIAALLLMLTQFVKNKEEVKITRVIKK